MRRPPRLLLAALAATALLGAPRRLAAQRWLERVGLERLATLRRPVTLWGGLAIVEHRVTLGSEVEQATGPVLSLAAEGSATPWLAVRVAARGGRLDADWAPSEERRLGEVELGASAFPLPWIGVVGAASLRGYRTEFGRQKWTRLTIGPELRTPLYGEHVAGRVRLAAMPYLRVTDTRAPSRALEGDAAVTYENGRLRAAVTYALERYDFDAVAGGRRLEQLGGLTLALGWRLGDGGAAAPLR